MVVSVTGKGNLKFTKELAETVSGGGMEQLTGMARPRSPGGWTGRS